MMAVALGALRFRCGFARFALMHFADDAEGLLHCFKSGCGARLPSAADVAVTKRPSRHASPVPTTYLRLL